MKGLIFFFQNRALNYFKTHLTFYLSLFNAGIYRFVEYVKDTFPHLDILINNAAQTIRRPAQFYSHLCGQEHTPVHRLPAEQQAILVGPALVTDESLCLMTKQTETSPSVTNEGLTLSESDDSDEPLAKRQCHEAKARTLPEPNLSLCNEEEVPAGSAECPTTVTSVQIFDSNHSMSTYFPKGQLDEDGQQLDLRPTNSWRTVIEQVPTGELLEVLMINTVAPFILSQQLKPHMVRSPDDRKFVVNVSAMEGQFNRAGKTKYHPHTNMAKAALNMMTRTAALGWAEDHIYMSAVDTGWVTDERPHWMASSERDNKGFVLPLDCVDGAARVYDPIVCGYTGVNAQPYYAVFLKDYKPYPW